MEQKSIKNVKHNIIHYESTGSTNEDAKMLAREGADDGTVVMADAQSAGKGRRGRTWQSPAGSNLYFSLMLKPEFSPDKASMLTLVMALSVVQALNRLMKGVFDFRIKWPNDIVTDGKKLCGILTEMNLDKGAIESVVIGVGINVNQEHFSEDISDCATSLLLEKKRTDAGITIPDRMELLETVLEFFDSNYELFCKNLNLEFMKSGYEGYLANMNNRVKVLEPAGDYEGQ
ncbi:MAG: biotin--[acetyl-CoA-carboxylase] ligase, partial [Agathobacter sp.]|nr:biotin--[acetyl-CoA-carboxylase] ligase [Agathobacter sp.]